MKIAQIAPLAESVPPRLYGGTERIVSYLTEDLVAQGHDVTLFASGNSQTSARLVKCTPAALRLNPAVRDPLPHHLLMLEQVRQRAQDFDILHFHIDLMQFPLISTIATPSVTTLHGRLDLPDLMPLYRAFPEVPLISISDAQRAPMPPVNWVRTIHHGLPRDRYRFSPRATGGYLAFLGRISPEKRPDRAIEIATRAGMKLRIAAKVDNVDLAYWQAEIEPLVRGQPAGRLRWRDQRAREGRLPRRRQRTSLPHRLAGALRPRHDRGHGLWHPRHCLLLRLRPRGGRSRRERLSRDLDRGGHRRRPSRRSSRPGAGACDFRAAFFHRAGGGRLSGSVFVALRPRPPAPPGRRPAADRLTVGLP